MLDPVPSVARPRHTDPLAKWLERETRIAAVTRPLRHALGQQRALHRPARRAPPARGDERRRGAARARAARAPRRDAASRRARRTPADRRPSRRGERARAIDGRPQVASTSAAEWLRQTPLHRALTSAPASENREAKENHEMTEQSTNGPVDEAVFEAGVLERGAELSAQMVRPQPAAEITPERTAAELRGAAGADRRGEAHGDDGGRRLRRGARNRQGDPVQARRREAGARVQARRAAQQRADLGPRRAPHRDLPRDRVPRADRRPARATGRASAQAASATARTASRSAPVRTAAAADGDQGQGRSTEVGWLCWRKKTTAAAPSSPTAISGSRARRSARSRTPTCPTRGTPSTRWRRSAGTSTRCCR